MSSNNTVIKLSKPYTKIDDISPVFSIYAMTKEVAEYSGDVVEVVAGGITTHQIGFNPQDYIDSVDMLAQVGGVTGAQSKWYDQKGSQDLAQTVNTNRPNLITSGVLETAEGITCTTFDGVDNILDGGLPYAAATAVVSCVVVFTPLRNGSLERIISGKGVLGLWISKNTSNQILIQSRRAAGTTNIFSTATLTTGNTYVIGAIWNRNGNLSIFINGVLDTSSADLNSDINMPTEVNYGAIKAGGGAISQASNISVQLVAWWQNNQSSNMLEYYTELISRYDITIDNEEDFIYFSDTPVLLSNGHKTNGRLVGDINFTESIKVFPWQGVNQGGFGSIDLVNIDSVYNSLVTTDFTKIDIYLYDGTTLTEFGRGEINNIGYIEKGRVRITMKSVIDKLNVELPTGRFSAIDHPELENEKKQLCLGRVNLPDVRLIDVATNEYFVSDDLFGVVTVYDEGISVGFTATGTGFTLTFNPSGRILPIIDGLDDGLGAVESHISQHIPRLLANIDIEFNQTELNSIYAGITSTWSGTEQSVITGINELLDGFISYMYADSSGELRFGTLALPVSPTNTLIEIETIGEIKAFRDRAQGLSNKLKNSRNYNPYSKGEIVFGATENDKINLIKDYKKTSVLTGLNPFYLDKNNVEMTSQSLGGITNGDIILQDIIDLWSEIRFFYTVASNKEFDLNEVVTVTHSLKGLEAGKNLLVVEKKKSTLTNKIIYKFWG